MNSDISKVHRVLDAIEELHRLERSDKTTKDLKAVLIETRTALTNYQAELMSYVLKHGKGKNLEVHVELQKTLQTAINVCNTGALMSDMPASPSARIIATYVISEGGFSGIEAFLKVMRSAK